MVFAQLLFKESQESASGESSFRETFAKVLNQIKSSKVPPTQPQQTSKQR